MKKLLILLVVALSGLVHADWKLNPYTQRQDYYEATGSLHVSTATLNARINAVAISTGANASAIAAETAARVAGDAALALSTAPLKDYANWNTAYGWGDHAGKYLISPASFTYLNDASKFLVAPASFTYQSPGNYITSLTGDVTASGPGSASATVADDSHLHSASTLQNVVSTGTSFSGDVTGAYNATVVGDNSHLHSASSLQNVVSTGTAFGGDVTGTYGATVVGNDSHNHTGTTISNFFASTDALKSAHLGAVNNWTATQNFQTITSTSVCIGGVCSEVWPEGGGGGGTPISYAYDNFYAQTNGSQATFTLSQAPLPNSLQLTKNGIRLIAPADYSLSEQIITMVTAPASSTTLVAMYSVGTATDVASIAIDGGPIGSIITYSTTTPPSGYLYCDGSYVSTTTYSALFAVTGHRYSTFTVSGSPALFQLPDMRGMFARGAEGTTDMDADLNRVVGSTQTDTMQGHYHNLRFGYTPTTGGGIDVPYGWNDYISDKTMRAGWGVLQPTEGLHGPVRVSTETRPENIAFAYMIKYAHTGQASIQLATTSVILASNNNWTGANSFSTPPTGIRNSTATILTATSFTSATFGAAVTGSTLTITTAQGFVMVGFSGSYKVSGAGYRASVGFVMDKVVQYVIGSYPNTADELYAIPFTWIVPVSAGTHTFYMVAATQSAATITIPATTGPAGTPYNSTGQFWIQELR